MKRKVLRRAREHMRCTDLKRDSENDKWRFVSWAVLAHISNPSTCDRGRRISEFEPRLVYTVSSRAVRTMQRNPVENLNKRILASDSPSLDAWDFAVLVPLCTLDTFQ